MIVFCEDCGAKNRIEASGIIDGKAVFTCTSCRYANAWRMGFNVETPRDTDALFHAETRAIKQLIGACLYHRQQGILKNTMPGILAPEDLELLGQSLSDLFMDAHALLPDISQMSLAIADKHLTFKPVEKDIFILLAEKTAPFPGKAPFAQMETDTVFLVEKEGRVIATHPEVETLLCETIPSWGKKAEAIGRGRLVSTTFSRKDHGRIFIFPVGKYYLGVIKSGHIDLTPTTDDINALLEKILRRSS